MTLPENYLDSLRARGLAAGTIYAYRRVLNRLFLFSPSAAEAEPEALLAFLNAEYAGKSLSCRTVGIAALRGFYLWLSAEEYRADNPATSLEYPAIPALLPGFLEQSEVAAMESKIEGTAQYSAAAFRAVFGLLYGSGLRAGEVRRVRRGDINFERGMVRVHGKGGRVRIVPLGAPTMAAFKEMRDRDWPLPERTTVWRFVHRLGTHPHKLRHTFATHLLKGGAEVRAIQELLGHENINTTMIYTHVDIKDLKDAVGKYHPRNSDEILTKF